MGKGVNDIDSMMRSLVNDRLGEIADGKEEGVSDPGPVDDEEQIEGLFSRCSSQEGYYGKVYRKSPVPAEFGSRAVFLTDIPQPETIDDIESELLRLGQMHSWPDGLYEVKLFKRGESGVRKARRMALQFPKSIPNQNINPGYAPPVNPFETLTQTAKVIRDLQDASKSSTPPYQPPAQNPEAILAAVTEAYKAGIEVAKGNGNNDGKIFEIIKAVKELAPPPEPPKSPNLLELIQALGALSKHNNPPPVPQEDMLDKLIKLKAAGFLGSDAPKEDSTTKAMEMLGTMIPLIQSLGSGGGDGGNTSTVIELIRQLAPQAGKIIGDVTGTINNAIGLKKTAMSNNPNPMYYPEERVPQITNVPSQPSYMDPYAAPNTEPHFNSPVVDVNPGPSPNPTNKLTPEEEAMFGFFRKFRGAIETNEPKFYPELKSVLQGVVPPDTFTQIVEGTIPVSAISDKIRPYGGDYFSSPQAHKYMQDFILWIRSQEVTGMCVQCNEEYLYDSETQIESDNICMSCGGQIKVKVQG